MFNLEDKEDDFEVRDEKVDERIEAIKVEKERNKNRIQTLRRNIKKAMWMLDQNKEFYKLVEKLVGSQFAAENGIMYELDMDLINLGQQEKRVENREIDEFDLKDYLDMMGRKTMLPIVMAIDGLNVMCIFDITGLEEEIDDEINEKDVKLDQIIKKKH